QSWRRARTSLWLINLGLAGLFPTILLGLPLKLFFGLMILNGVVLYWTELRAIFRARRRRLLDWGLRYFITAQWVLGACCVLALLLNWPGVPMTFHTGQLENLYGFLFLVGVMGFAIPGMLYKIIPFLVWYARYGEYIGRTEVPTLAKLN